MGKRAACAQEVLRVEVCLVLRGTLREMSKYPIGNPRVDGRCHGGAGTDRTDLSGGEVGLTMQDLEKSHLPETTASAASQHQAIIRNSSHLSCTKRCGPEDQPRQAAIRSMAASMLSVEPA